MSEQTAIEWCDSTFNPWIGCTKVSDGCTSCYAEVSTPARTMKVLWGNNPRHRTSAANWAQPVSWNRNALSFELEHGRRRRVFCASLADVFDNQVPAEWRVDLWDLIRATPRLDWLLLTKRVGNVRAMLPDDWGDGYPNVWLGHSVVNQDEANWIIERVLEIPARVHWLSMEPLLGPVDLCHLPLRREGRSFLLGSFPENAHLNALRGYYQNGAQRRIGWVVVGGESGNRARPFVLGWGKDIVRQCAAMGVPVLVKQIGACPTNREGVPHPAKHPKGGDMAEWPEILRVREYPEVVS